VDSTNIFFDLDDTLVTTRQTIFLRINTLVKKFSLDINPADVYGLLGNPNRREILARTIGKKIPFWEGYELLRKKIGVNSIPGVGSALEALVLEGRQLGIITNNTLKKTLEKLRLAKIDTSLFQGNIYSCLDNGCLKPSPEIVIRANLCTKNTKYIGDSIEDYFFTINSGMEFYAVCTGEHNAEDFRRVGLRERMILPNIQEVLHR